MVTMPEHALVTCSHGEMGLTAAMQARSSTRAAVLYNGEAKPHVALETMAGLRKGAPGSCRSR